MQLQATQSTLNDYGGRVFNFVNMLNRTCARGAECLVVYLTDLASGDAFALRPAAGPLPTHTLGCAPCVAVVATGDRFHRFNISRKEKHRDYRHVTTRPAKGDHRS